MAETVPETQIDLMMTLPAPPLLSRMALQDGYVFGWPFCDNLSYHRGTKLDIRRDSPVCRTVTDFSLIRRAHVLRCCFHCLSKSAK